MELGHNGRLNVNVDPKKNFIDPGIYVHFSKMARYIWLKNFQSISRTLMLIGIKMKKIVTELGHSEGLKIYVNPSKIYVNPGI